jgi:hypothetical protein
VAAPSKLETHPKATTKARHAHHMPQIVTSSPWLRKTSDGSMPAVLLAASSQQHRRQNADTNAREYTRHRLQYFIRHDKDGRGQFDDDSHAMATQIDRFVGAQKRGAGRRTLFIRGSCFCLALGWPWPCSAARGHAASVGSLVCFVSRLCTATLLHGANLLLDQHIPDRGPGLLDLRVEWLK